MKKKNKYIFEKSIFVSGNERSERKLFASNLKSFIILTVKNNSKKYKYKHLRVCDWVFIYITTKLVRGVLKG